MDKQTKKWDKARVYSCAVEVASIIGRNEEIGCELEYYKMTEKQPSDEKWLLLDDEVKALADELELAQGYCELKLKDAKKEHGKLADAIEKKDLDSSLMVSSGLKVSVMSEVNRAATKELLRRIKETPST